MALRWIGYTKGQDGIPDIPARDLTDEEVEQFGGEAALLATGLYEKENLRGKAGKAIEDLRGETLSGSREDVERYIQNLRDDEPQEDED